MGPKRKAKQATEPVPTPPTDTKPATTATKEVPQTQTKTEIKPVPPKVQANKPVQKPADKPLGKEELDTKPGTLIKLGEKEAEKKVISLGSTVKSEKELRELRAFKFGGKQTAISIDDAANLISERAKKFGGKVPISSEERRRRIEKFGGADKEQEKELKRKRLEKFSNKPSESLFTGPAVLSKEEQEVLEARRLKFNSNPVEAPHPSKQLKSE